MQRSISRIICLLKHHAMKTYAEVDAEHYAFLFLAQMDVSGQLNAPLALTLGKESPYLLDTKLFYFIISGVGLTSPGTAATSGLLYSPKW
jgi:hypothetical protein